MATLRADRQIVIPNLLFVVQRDPGGSDVTGLTLISSQPAPDGSRMTFGTSQNVANLDRLTGLQMNLGGHRLLDPRGNGVFTSFSAYQPKFATITITKVGENDVSGSVSGEFYRFRALQPAQRPDTVNVEGAFSAVLIIR